MHSLISCLVLALLTVAYAEDCSQAIQHFRECREKFRDEQQAKRPDQKERQTAVSKCFTESGCKAPNFDDNDDKDDKDDARKAAKECHKAIAKKARGLVKTCEEKKTGIKLPEKQHKDEDGEKREHHFDVQDELKSQCKTDEQRNKTRQCMRKLRDEKKEEREEEAEARFNANCGNKRECFGKLSATCQKKFNETKAAACDCAKSELTPKQDEFQKEAEKCRANKPSKGGKGDGSQRPHKGSGEKGGDGGEPHSFVFRAIKRACNTEDRCDKPFEPREHGSGKGKGKGEGKGKGKGEGKGKAKGGNH